METSQGFFRTQRDPFWLFLILSVAAANAINMNLQLPYYTQNIIFLSLMFFYFDKIVPNSASIRRKKASALLKIENPIVERT